MGDPPQQPTIDPATLRIQQEAQADKITAIQDRVTGDTRDTLIRFGRQKAFSGAGNLSGGGPSLLNAGLLGGRKLGLLGKL